MKSQIEMQSGVRKRHIYRDRALRVDTNSCRIQQKASTAKHSDHNRNDNTQTTRTGVLA